MNGLKDSFGRGLEKAYMRRERPVFRLKGKSCAKLVPMTKAKRPSDKELKKARKQMKDMKAASPTAKANDKPSPKSILKQSKDEDLATPPKESGKRRLKFQEPEEKKVKAEDGEKQMTAGEAEQILKDLEAPAENTIN